MRAMKSDCDFLCRFLLLRRRWGSSSRSQQCHGEGNVLSLEVCWTLVAGLIGFLFIPTSVCSTPTRFRLFWQRGRALSPCRGVQRWQRGCPRCFVSLLPCVCMSPRLGCVESEGCKAPRKQVDSLPGRDYSELLLCCEGVREWQQQLWETCFAYRAA